MEVDPEDEAEVMGLPGPTTPKKQMPAALRTTLDVPGSASGGERKKIIRVSTFKLGIIDSI